MGEKYKDSCRGCLARVSHDGTHFFLWPDIKELYMDCTTIKISTHDDPGLPQQLCSECYSKCEQWYFFKNMCLEVEQHLQTTTTTAQDAVSDDKEEISVKEEPKDEEDTIEDDLDEFNFGELVVDSSDVVDAFEADLKEHSFGVLIEDPPLDKDQPTSPIDQLNSHSEVVSQNKKSADLKQCLICQKRFPELYKHIFDEHCESGRKVCPICKRVLKSRCHLRIHLVVHTNERPFYCKLCPLDFKQKAELNGHIKKKHSAELNKFEKTGTEATLAEYIQERGRVPATKLDRTNEKKTVTKIIKASQRQSRYASDRKKPNIYKCPACDKAMPLGNMRTHFVTHTTETPFECSYCKAHFSFARNARNHCEKKHSKSQEARVVLKKGSIFENKRPWEAMGYSLGHSVVHTAEKPFTCKYCLESFTWLHRATMHIEKCHLKEDAVLGVVIDQDTVYANRYSQEIGKRPRLESETSNILSEQEIV